MAGMDLSGRRADRGVSVFWMILTMGAGVFALIAILLVGTNEVTVEEDSEVAENVGGGEVLVNDGETVVVGRGNTSAASDENDATYLDQGTVAVDAPTEEGDLSVEDVEVEVEAGEPVNGAGVEPSEAGTDADAEIGGEVAQEDEALMGEDVEPVAPGAGEIVVDPDGTTAPVVPTPVGPGTGDGNGLLAD